MMLMASSKWKLLRIKMKTPESHFTESTAADTGIFHHYTNINTDLKSPNIMIVIIYEMEQGWNKAK